MSAFVNSYAWIALVLVQYFIISYLSLRASKEQATYLFVVIWSLGLLPTWTFVVKYSANLILAGFIYDFTLAFGWVLGIIIFQGKDLTAYQYTGMGLMAAGILLFKR